jgi:hypothetical protein
LAAGATGGIWGSAPKACVVIADGGVPAAGVWALGATGAMGGTWGTAPNTCVVMADGGVPAAGAWGLGATGAMGGTWGTAPNTCVDEADGCEPVVLSPKSSVAFRFGWVDGRFGAAPNTCVVWVVAWAGVAAMKTWLQRVHCTGTPPGGNNRGSSAYCIEHWGQAISTHGFYHTPRGAGAYRSSVVAWRV